MATTNQTAADLRELRQEVKQLAETIQKTAKHATTGNGAAEVFGFDRKQLQRMARKAGRNVRHFIDEKNDQVHQLRDDAEDRITSHPFISVATAVAGGVLLGALLRRR